MANLNPFLVQEKFRASKIAWDDIPADFQNAMVSANPGFIMPSMYSDLLGGSASELPWYEHPGTWVAGAVAGAHACVVFCGSAASMIGEAGTSLGAACATSSICLQIANLLNGISGGRSGSNETTRLYRAVSEQEYQDIMRNGVFREVAKSASGKYFATTATDAQRWGERMIGQNFRVLVVDFSSEVVKGFYHWDSLDDIGPAFYATMEQLTNYTIRGEIYVR